MGTLLEVEIKLDSKLERRLLTVVVLDINLGSKLGMVVDRELCIALSAISII
jgi:hypothetical protein